ncbi:nitrate reductase [Parazoarcus communis]|uniref:nitrate reductase (cytochrome) n=1 Tax=Parazoarcus communis SWub3 = DSM 12120 TaxID=1121029 RepID=A0A323UZM2_9RHOO|nr:nitrate reductase [Parazoarcus communis]NMG68709.1 molybdopterin-dependent oxidoreductase [Parazoarcus communis SWub3 = DSM 12120]PZA17965.1 nitrate reductase [Azoarcus communis] [Parazoarcus communis SWub3 = DSM 12120]
MAESPLLRSTQLSSAQTTRSTCPYCGVGCGVLIEHDGKHITGVRGDPEHPANFGKLCIKGTTLHHTADPALLSARAQYPALRPTRDAAPQRVSWDVALDTAAARFADIISRHGPDAVAFYFAGQLLTEDYYVFNKLAKGLIGTNNFDTNSRLCMSSAVVGYKLSFGMDSVPCNYEDIDHADCLFITGANPAFAHPILFRRVEAARERRPGQKIIVVDPRRTDTSELADLHLAILPGTDVALYNGMLHLALKKGWVREDYIAAHTEGFDAMREIVRDYPPAHVAERCGIREQDLEQAAEWFATSPATLSMYCQGLNQSTQGAHKNAALINLHLATAQLGRPGAGPLSLTGQPNAMGGREVGGLSNLLPGHREVANPEHRAEVARLWGVPSLPATPGKSAVELFQALADGSVKAVWIGCTNPAQSMPDLGLIDAALKRAEFVVLQDAYRHTETAAYADLILPATTWGEKDGTVTNSERRISRVRTAVPPPGEARHDWAIGVAFAHRLGHRLGREDVDALFAYDRPETIWNEHRETTRGRDLDITGLSYPLLEAAPRQWPCPEGYSEGLPRLYSDGRFPTPSGRARFVATTWQNTAEQTNARYPLQLNTGRLRDQWHGMSRTGTVARLYSHESEPLLHIHPQDLASRQLHDGDWLQVHNPRGKVVVRARASTTVPPGQVFLPMHWGANAMAGLGINALTTAAFDPLSKQPELKHAAVQVEALAGSTELFCLRRAEDGGGQALLQALRPLLRRLDAASLTLAGRDQTVVVLRARLNAPDPALLADIDAMLDLGQDDEHLLSYDDARHQVSKRARIENGQLTAVRLCGEARAANWLQALAESGTDITPLRRFLFAPLNHAPAGLSAATKVVCNCYNVSETTIRKAFAAGESLTDLQQRTGCGTGCGSCMPELRRLGSHTPVEAMSL